jgi:predicted phosphoadenosine phosphosulfate sulfurtransferase
MKKYLEQNVYEASQERLKFIFDNFERVYLSFSGGKDSGVMLNLTLDYMRANNIKEKIGVLVVDLEGQYKATIDYILDTIDNNLDLIEPYFVCLPLNLRNAVSVFNPFWTCWDSEQKDKWIRQMPVRDYVISQLNYFDFFKEKMEFEEFTPAFGEWFSQGKKTACLVGIRSDESLNRYRTIASKEKKMFHNKIWTTKICDNVFNCYPIYDWTTEDIWIGNDKLNWHYNYYHIHYHS